MQLSFGDAEYNGKRQQTTNQSGAPRGCMAANEADITQVHKLVHGREDTLCGDSDHTGLVTREEMRRCKARYLLAEKPSKVAPDQSEQARAPLGDARGHTKASLRAKVDHLLRVIKHQFGYTRVRYRG